MNYKLIYINLIRPSIQKTTIYSEGFSKKGITLIVYHSWILKNELNMVYMQWSTEIIDSPYREGNKFPDTGDSYKEFRDLLDDSDGPTSWIEFWEEVK